MDYKDLNSNQLEADRLLRNWGRWSNHFNNIGFKRQSNLCRFMPQETVNFHASESDIEACNNVIRKLMKPEKKAIVVMYYMVVYQELYKPKMTQKNKISGEVSRRMKTHSAKHVTSVIKAVIDEVVKDVISNRITN